MHPHIEQVLEVFRDEGVRLNTVTNATLIRERLGRLIGDTFSSLTVSVDGADKETYEYVRLGSSWERLLRGIDHVNRHRNPDLRLIIGVVMLKCNIHQLPDFVRFAAAHDAQELQAAWLVPFHDLPWTATQRLTDDPVRTNHFMDEARAVGDELGISVRIPDNLPLDVATTAEQDLDLDRIDLDEFGAAAAPETHEVVHLN
jgi:MoaA/NifB/PqqE/SkfB family radical SAM enzyme